MQNRDDLGKLAGSLGGLPVLGCRPNSPATRAGIRYGDIVLTVNGQPTPDWAAYVAARALNPTEMTVEVFRGGQTIVHTLTLDRGEPVEPLSLLAELIDQRILGATTGGDGADPEAS